LIAPETDSENPWRYKFHMEPSQCGDGKDRERQSFYRMASSNTPLSAAIQTNHERNGRMDMANLKVTLNRDSLKYRETTAFKALKRMLRGTFT